MAGEELFTLQDDLPKEDPWKDDLLGFAPFAERLSKVIASLEAPNGYVIGLHGEWGSGKSTALNFVNAFLKRHNDSAESERARIQIIDFRPWIVSGHQDLIAAFFKILFENLASKRANWLRRQWSRILRLFKVTSDPLLDAIATVAVTVDPSAGVASRAAATVAKKSLGGVIDSFLAEPSLQAAYEDLKAKLQERGKRFLVTVDDLDRLQNEEIRSIMQMVKTVGRLPNVVYILAYDRAIVWDALDGAAVRVGPRFAEKIVQQELELPRPSKHSLLTILASELSFLPDPPAASLRWHYIVQDGVRRWVRYPRDVLRLANAVKFSWPALIGEIDPQDLLAMEGLRLFDGIAFDFVRSSRELLFSEGRFLMATDELRQARVSDLKGKLPLETRDQVIHLLSALFPSHSEIFEGKKFMSSNESQIEVVKRRGIGCEAGYDTYFALYPSPDAVPKAVIDGMMQRLEDEPALVTIFERFIGERDQQGQPMIGELLDELRYRFQGHDAASPTQELLDALFNVGEPIFRLEWKGDIFEASPRVQIARLVSVMLSAWGSDEAGRHLVAAFEKSQSPAFESDVFVARARELGVIKPGSQSPPLVSMETFKTLGTKLLSEIEKAAENGMLENAPFFWSIIPAWKYLGGSEKPKAWIQAGINRNARFLAKIADGLVGETASTSGRGYTMDARPDEDLYDLTALLAASQKHLTDPELTREDIEKIRVMVQAIEKMMPPETIGETARLSPAQD